MTPLVCFLLAAIVIILVACKAHCVDLRHEGFVAGYKTARLHMQARLGPWRDPKPQYIVRNPTPPRESPQEGVLGLYDLGRLRRIDPDLMRRVEEIREKLGLNADPFTLLRRPYPEKPLVDLGEPSFQLDEPQRPGRDANGDVL